MNKPRLAIFSLILCALFVFGCGSGSNRNTTPPQSAAVSFTMTDTPPAGVTLLSFEVNLTGATLNPGGADLLAGRGPVSIEIENLQTESAFLNTAKVAPGTYTSLSLTFANPEVTFKNDTTATLAGCAIGAVCEINPTGALTSTFTFPGSGIMIAANSSTAIQVDVNPNIVLSAMMGVDFSQTGAVTAQQLTTQPEGELEELDDLEGFVKSVDTGNQQFVLTTVAGDFTIKVNSQTQFENFTACMANPKDISCLQANQAVEVDVALMAGGMFLATQVELKQEQVDDELQGVVFKVDNPTQFELVVLEELRDINGVAVGNPIQVTLNAAQFQVDTDGLTIPSSSQMFVNNFNSATDTSQLLSGQVVQIHVQTLASVNNVITVTTDRVGLRMSQFTATVSGAPAGNNFNVGSLPSLFTSNGISTIQVQTIPGQTEFEGVMDITGLAANDTVSLRGLLLKTGADPSANPPLLIARKVRKR